MADRSKAAFQAAAETLPSQRTSAQKDLVKEAHEQHWTEITNLDHAAREEEKTYGPRGRH